MKVCTDACLFGAWVAEKVLKQAVAAETVLDIGTGTGLLSLMVAQTFVPSAITAIEINDEAAQQAQQNFILSAWGSRLHLMHGDIKEVDLPAKYDLIICNPPFYENDLKSTQAAKNHALHSTALTLQQLLDCIVQNLEAMGHFAVLLPYSRTGEFENLAKDKRFFLKEKCLVKQTEKHSWFRSMLLFSTSSSTATKQGVTIKINGNYSAEFAALLQGYYLYL